jgi:DNA primase
MTWLDDLVLFAQTQVDDRVRETLYGRGVSDEQFQVFKIGYLNQVLPSLPELATPFLRWSHNGARLDDVLVLPLTNSLGTVQGFQFRHVERERTGYLDFLPFKEEPVLFGLGQAMSSVWETGEITLVEGAFDLFPFQRHVSGVVATLTANVTTSFVRFLQRLVRCIWLGYDADITGKRAAAHFLREHGRDFAVKIIDYPKVSFGSGRSVKDPGELWEVWGDVRFGEFIRVLRSSNLMEFPNG